MKHRIISAHRAGQAIPILGLSLLLLLAFSALAIDGAMAFAWRRNVANGADAVALVATRALIADYTTVREREIHDAVESYLATELGETAPQFEVYFVDNSGQRLPLNNPQPLNGSSNARPGSAVRGVSVEVTHTFDTYLMRVLGQDTLTVGAVATTRYGNAGTVSGEFVAPLALLNEAATRIRTNPTDAFPIDLGEQIDASNAAIEAAWLADPAYDGSDPSDPAWRAEDEFLQYFLVRSIALRMGATTPVLGGSSGCPSGTTTLKSWWCHGTSVDVSTRISEWNDQSALALDLVGVSFFDSSLVTSAFVGSREGEIIVVPVLAESEWSGGSPDPAYVIEYFMALEVTDVDLSNQTMEVRYVDRYVTNGGLMGSNNNVERGNPCEVCVVNLVRDT